MYLRCSFQYRIPMRPNTPQVTGYARYFVNNNSAAIRLAENVEFPSSGSGYSSIVILGSTISGCSIDLHTYWVARTDATVLSGRCNAKS